MVIDSLIFFFTWGPPKVPNEKHKQYPKVVVTISIANVQNARVQHGKLYHGGLVRYFCNIEPQVSHTPTKHDSTNTVILGLSSVRG